MSTIPWRPFPISPSLAASSSTSTSSISPLPPLLISTSFTTTTYTVALTDLTHLWRESLSRRAILKRSLAADTSIDPSEDGEQLRLFLAKLSSALSGAPGTSLALRAQPRSSTSGTASGTASAPAAFTADMPVDVPALELNVAVQLPKGMRDLEWRFEMLARPPVELRRCLMVPLMRAVRAGAEEVRGLVEVIAEKDLVIRKLSEKLESVGMEVGGVFPGVGMAKTGRKGVSRKVLEERVKGLGAFEVNAWRRGMRERQEKMEVEKDEDVVGIVGEVFGGENEVAMDYVEDDGNGKRQDWWERVKETPLELWNRIDGHESKDENALGEIIQEHHDSSSEQVEDDFQIQATPAHLNSDDVSPPKAIRSHAIIQDSTDDDGEDLDAASQRSLVPDSVPLSSSYQGPRKILATSRSKPTAAPAAKAPNASSKPAPESKSNGKNPVIIAVADDDDDETASEDDEADHPPVKAPPPISLRRVSPEPVRLKNASASGGALGRIGGKTKEVPPAIMSSVVAAAAVAAEEGEEYNYAPAPEHKAKHRLGVIGHKAPGPGPGPGPGADEAEKRHGARDNKGGGVKEASAAAAAAAAAAAKTEDADDEDDEGGDRDGKKEKAGEEREEETALERADRKREELKRALEEKARAPGRKRRKF